MDFSNVKINEGYNYIVSEKGNTFVALRKITWDIGREEKLDLRKYVVNSDGSEKMMKGISFDDETAHELVHIMTNTGYGDTRVIMGNLRERPDFKDALSYVLTDEEKEGLDLDLPDVPEEEYFDIRSMMNL